LVKVGVRKGRTYWRVEGMPEEGPEEIPKFDDIFEKINAYDP